MSSRLHEHAPSSRDLQSCWQTKVCIDKFDHLQVPLLAAVVSDSETVNRYNDTSDIYRRIKNPFSFSIFSNPSCDGGGGIGVVFRSSRSAAFIMDRPQKKLDLTKPEELDEAFSRQRDVSCRGSTSIRSMDFLEQKGPSMWDARYQDERARGVQFLKSVDAVLKEHCAATEPYEELTYNSGRVKLTYNFLNGLSDDARMIFKEAMERLLCKPLSCLFAHI
jgi:hypothetical protein